MGYAERDYLSVVEAAQYLGLRPSILHQLEKAGAVPANRSASGQKRFRKEDLDQYTNASGNGKRKNAPLPKSASPLRIRKNGAHQTIYFSDSRSMKEVPSDSVRLMVTSPPLLQRKVL